MTTRRPPPAFRIVEVGAVTRPTPRLARVTFGGLGGFPVPDPGASVRLLLPDHGSGPLVVPEWNGNEFLLADGSRPFIRTLTPWRIEKDELDVGIVLHPGGALATWAAEAGPGDQVGVSGPGRGYAIDPTASGFVLLGDETALPAITQLLGAIPAGIPVDVHVEIADSEARLAPPERIGLTMTWHVRIPDARPGETLVDAARAVDLPPGVRVWAAGEASAVQKIRRILFDDRALSRSSASVRGYWKDGRSGDPADS